VLKLALTLELRRGERQQRNNPFARVICERSANRGFANAGVEFNREGVAKLIRNIGRETADKAEQLFTFINNRFSA
jgi:hypothetical protein